MSRRTRRIEKNARGRDFVVGDVHGEFATLEYMLGEAGFESGRDRLFALGDLIERGPRSAEALQWLDTGAITLSVRGNHEQMLADRIARAEHSASARKSLSGWFTDNVAPSEWKRWRTSIEAMPIAATLETTNGWVGLIHASVCDRWWSAVLRRIEAGDPEAIGAALWSAARARGDAAIASFEGVPHTGNIHGVRAVLSGHAIVTEVRTSANVWHIDTGAGSPEGALTLVRVDGKRFETRTMKVVR